MDQQISTFDWEGGSQTQNISTARPAENSYGETITPLLPIIDDEDANPPTLHSIISPRRNREDKPTASEKLAQISISQNHEEPQPSPEIQREINIAQAFLADTRNFNLLSRYTESNQIIQKLTRQKSSALSEDQKVQLRGTIADMEGKSQQLRYEYMQSTEYKAYRQKMREIGQHLHAMNTNISTDKPVLPSSMRESIFSYSPSNKIGNELFKIKSWISELAVLRARLINQPQEMEEFFGEEQKRFLLIATEIESLIEKRKSPLETSALLLADYYIHPEEPSGPIALKFDLEVLQKHAALLEKFLKNPDLFNPDSMDQFRLALQKIADRKKFLEAEKNRLYKKWQKRTGN